MKFTDTVICKETVQLVTGYPNRAL